jgi:hypothetical protein
MLLKYKVIFSPLNRQGPRRKILCYTNTCQTNTAPRVEEHIPEGQWLPPSSKSALTSEATYGAPLDTNHALLSPILDFSTAR